ncbi:MAG: carboxy terminal-processing peptidase [Bacteroidetes bacterium]|nr:carboxy terminal-processing peptidase [Bacteroidota bacterium]
MKKTLPLAFFFFILIISGTVFALSGQKTAVLGPVTLEPEPKHAMVSKIVSFIVSKNHYSPKPLNDSLSSRILDKYIGSLDFYKIYFFRNDLVEFEGYRYQIDDMLKSGDLAGVYLIFNRFSKRLNERIDYALGVVDSNFNFNADESFQFDRENATWFTSEKEMNDYWRKRIKYEVLNLVVAGRDSTAAKTVRKRYENLRSQIAKNNSEDVFQIFMNAFSEEQDPHSSYFSPKTSEDFKINMSLSLEGIGAQLTQENDYVKIRELIAGGPAFRSKELAPNDRITGVGQGDSGEVVDVVGWRLDDVVSLIRGPKGTVVRLLVIGANDDLASPGKIVKLTRDKIKLEEQAAKSQVIEVNFKGKTKKIGVIKVPTFYTDFEARQRGDKDYKSTTRDVKRLIAELKEKKVDGLMIDVRSDGGGSLQEAIDLTGLFINTGPVVQVKDYRGTIEVDEDNDPGVSWDGPLAVLVNRYSASASEIFAAAIQDWGRGVIIGDQSFGKGTVQNLVDLDRYFQGTKETKAGQLKLTIAKFYRVNGGSTQINGVTPDIEMPSLIDKTKAGEASEATALQWDKIAPANYKPVADLQPLIKQLSADSKKRMEADQEFIFLLDDKKDVLAESKKNEVSLNITKLKAERDAKELKKKAREASRIASKIQFESEGVADQNEDGEKPDDAKKTDPVLTESATITAHLGVLKPKW